MEIARFIDKTLNLVMEVSKIFYDIRLEKCGSWLFYRYRIQLTFSIYMHTHVYE